MLLQGISGSGFDYRELIDSFEQTVELGQLRGGELLLRISSQHTFFHVPL